MKRSTLFMLTLLAFGLSVDVQAACSPTPNLSNSVTFPTTIVVPPSLPVGGLIASQQFGGTFPIFTIGCISGTVIPIYGRYGSEYVLPGVGYVHNTNVPGIAMRVKANVVGGSQRDVSLATRTLTVYDKLYYDFTGLRADFYKTGPVTDGIVPSGSLRDESWNPGRIQMLLDNSIRFVNQIPTCDLATGDVNRTITLPTVKVSDLTDVISAGAFNFDLTANCNNASSVTFRFTGTPAPNDSWRFANTGTAGGTALWLYSRIGGVNQTIRANGTDNARTVAVSNNRAVLPLGAAYFRVGTVSQGTLASTATVNITYN
ncbi:fimbrial protein [Pseudomonas fluorescens]|uniref:Fimbrial protein n=1 Tax=Pseudomonas lactucae TaxID=2813360 RepID=A0A9X0Y6M8_9PSED|nr:fimbrial protein [Pseudomonas lactucae]OPA97980.1 fimbrial protein [Pseudomonas fluorescens]MBN2974620.1 fimbrial protein [Pseudomonas lactucae]MBN2988654.1 fimbrial protein [Pseudomonas lactucae]OPB14592.1 fimbrial protein [Pseudomonas fluorescens]OPB27973.1 fimbrial protein [Pseudomonas fluorescens]